ncbi:hypothetical protein TRFO_35187 [Tritrichomonas foetus]|uniref:SPIN90/Ldb17 leucine-rich domain-containing protein n=1 Tax=Tritrichomonas foetus TaxID=1144522 RepID=A0A1J4JMD0_9EUKA|nr:hypothetical protein TRFO_35187 [Tritrichomonas foetus]|eukprot:OHS98412.1 hypothetical protein TRFO_35187 [Tritrichomonas foetus]
MIKEDLFRNSTKDVKNAHQIDKGLDTGDVNRFLEFSDTVPIQLLNSLYLMFNENTFLEGSSKTIELLIYHSMKICPETFNDLISGFINPENSEEQRKEDLIKLYIAIKNAPPEVELPLPQNLIDILFCYFPNPLIVLVTSELINRDYTWSYNFVQKVMEGKRSHKNPLSLFFIDLIHACFNEGLNLLNSLLTYKEYLIYLEGIFMELISNVSNVDIKSKILIFQILSKFFEGDDLFLTLLLEYEKVSELFLPIENDIELTEAILSFSNEVTKSNESQTFEFLQKSAFFNFLNEFWIYSLNNNLSDSKNSCVDVMNGKCFELSCLINERIIRTKKKEGISFLFEIGIIPSFCQMKEKFNYKSFQIFMHLLMLCVKRGNNNQILDILSLLSLVEIANYADSIEKDEAAPFLKKIATTILNYEKNGKKYFIDEETYHELLEIAKLEDKEDSKITEFLNFINPVFE